MLENSNENFFDTEKVLKLFETIEYVLAKHQNEFMAVDIFDGRS